ncbi:MAG: Fe-S cluster assembly protein SufD [Bdellovibrionota bacterium]
MSNIELFKNLFENTKLSDPTGDRKRSFARFEQLGLPTKADEAWKYTSLKPLLAKPYAISAETKSSAHKTDNEITITCMNGYFDIEAIKQSLSAYKLEVATYAEALLQKKIKILDSKDSFLALNSAFYENGLFISIPERVEVREPIVIKYNVEQGANFVNPRVYIEIKKESSLQLVEVYSIVTSEYLLNSSLQISVGERASFKALKHYDESFVSSHIDNTFIDQANSSSCQLIQLSKGSQLLRQNLEVAVNGEGANTDLRGIAILEKDASMDNFIKVHHKAPGSTSRQTFKSILRDQSHYVFQGNIRIEKEAQKTDSDQVNRNLMLGQKCHVDTKPQLDVFADDVKATHGAAIGQLNPDEKFYLESRSISPEKALDMLCAGFALDLLEDLKSPWIKNYLRDYL